MDASAKLPWLQHRTAFASQAGTNHSSQYFEGMSFLSSGQQLLVGPTGYGECGCIQNPVHVTMGDNHTCHPLYHQVADWIEIIGAVAVCYLADRLSIFVIPSTRLYVYVDPLCRVPAPRATW